MVAGIVRRDGAYIRCRGRLHKLPRTAQTVTAFVAGVELTGENMKTSTVFINDNGRFVRCTGPTYSVPEVCEWCGQEWCDCMAQATPLGADVQATCDAILRGDVEPCPVCGRYSCDCDEWHELMHADPLDPDPHGDLRALQAMDIPV